MRLPTPILALALLAASCVSTEDATESSPQASGAKGYEPSLPWTTAFLEPSLLVADAIHIEGPPGLVSHFAARVDEAFHHREEQTTTEGYRTLIRVRQGGALMEIRGYLDLLQIVALRELVVLERPGEVELSVEASGEVFYSNEASGVAERAASKRLVGRRPGPDSGS